MHQTLRNRFLSLILLMGRILNRIQSQTHIRMLTCDLRRITIITHKSHHIVKQQVV